MGTNDDSGKKDSDDTSKEVTVNDEPEQEGEPEGSVEVPRFGIFEQEGIEQSPSTKITLEVTYGGRTAKLEVEYAWTVDGSYFACHANKYWVTSFGGNSGNIELGFSSKTSWGMREISNDNAAQDGNWHTISGGSIVEGNASKATIEFSYTFDVSGGGDPSAWTSEDVSYAPVPTIKSPSSGDIPDQTLTVSGTGGVSGGRITVNNADGDGLLHNATIEGNGNWTTTFDLPRGPDTLTFYAKQFVGTSTSANSSQITVNLVRTTLTTPALNAVVRADQIVFKGAGFKDVQVRAIRPDQSGLSGKVSVGTDKRWEAPVNTSLPNGSCTALAEYQYGSGPLRYSEQHAFTVLDKLVITTPTANQEMNFTVSGTNGIPNVLNATVNVRIDFEGTYVGNGSVSSNGSWTVEIQMPKAGPTSLVAEQTYQGVTSQASVAQSFKIKPPKLTTVQVTYPNVGTVRFSGAGYTTAWVEIWTANGALEVDTEVTNGQWSVDWTNQPPMSARQMNARQRVADGTGWIYSAWDDGFTITVAVPVPILTTPQVGEERKPVFSGTGNTWSGQPVARVEVRLEGESTPAVPIVDVSGSNSSWSSTATEAWDPGTYYVQARQLFKPAGQDTDLSSEPTATQTFVIRAPLPTVELRPDGLTPHFSGTCLNRAQVTLWFDGDQNTPYDAVMNGATWTFTREQPFMPGAHSASVKQSIGGQTSDAATQPFDVPVLQPIITSPIDIDVDHNPVITGTQGVEGAVMYIHDYLTNALWGQAAVTGDAWSVHILEDLEFGQRSVYAVQKYELLESDRSERVIFTVILFPPTIDYPQPGDAMARVSTIEGYARKASGLDTAQVELWLDGEDEPLGKPKARGSDGYWSYEVYLPVGPYVLRARQFFADQVSEFGPNHPFTSVPAIPLIESPALQQQVGTTVAISGHGYAGDWVEVAWSDAPQTLLGRTQVQANRTWSLQLPIDKSAGQHAWIVQQECDGYRSGWSAEHPVRVLSSAPTFTAPGAGQWFAGTAFFEGTGQSGSLVEVSQWFDARQLVAQERPVTDGTWTASPEVSLTPGAHWVQARQSGSDWGDSPRFEVAQVEEAPLAKT